MGRRRLRGQRHRHGDQALRPRGRDAGWRRDLLLDHLSGRRSGLRGPCAALHLQPQDRRAVGRARLHLREPTATTVFDLGTHNRVTPTTSCEVACPTDGGDFVVTRVTGLTAITDDNIHDAVAEWVAQPAVAAVKFGHIAWWDTGTVRSFAYLFSTQSEFNDDLSHW